MARSFQSLPPPIRTATRLATALLLFLVTGAPRLVAAQAPNEAAAMIGKARALQAQGKTDEACELFASAEALAPDTQTTLLLARCLERAKRAPEAYRAYVRLVRAGREKGQIAIERAGEAGRAALTKEVALLQIRIEGSTPGETVTVDGREWPTTSADEAIPFAPREVTVVAAAPRRKPWRASVALVQGETKTLTIPALVEDVLQPVAADRADSREIRQIGDAVWSPAAGFVRTAERKAEGVPRDAARSLAPPGSMIDESLDRFEWTFGGSYCAYGFDGPFAEGAAMATSFGYESKDRFSPIAWWFVLEGGASFLFGEETVVGTPGGRFGIDFRPTFSDLHLDWIAVGPFLGFDGYLADVGDYGPELGYLHLALRTRETADDPPALRFDVSIFDRFGTEAAATYASARLDAGQAFRIGLTGTYRLGTRGDDTLAVSRAAEAGLFIGFGS